MDNSELIGAVVKIGIAGLLLVMIVQFFTSDQFIPGRPIPVGEFAVPVILSPYAHKGELSLSSLPNSPVILHFFASWCGVCQAEQPHIAELKRTYNLPIYGIAWQDNELAVRDWLNRNGSSYNLVALDRDGSATATFSGNGVPRTYILNAKKEIVYQQFGDYSGSPQSQAAMDKVMQELGVVRYATHSK